MYNSKIEKKKDKKKADLLGFQHVQNMFYSGKSKHKCSYFFDYYRAFDKD